jgi:hypothetical protein
MHRGLCGGVRTGLRVDFGTSYASLLLGIDL